MPDSLGVPRWRERHWSRFGGDMRVDYKPHVCTARSAPAFPPGAFDTLQQALADRRS